MNHNGKPIRTILKNVIKKDLFLAVGIMLTVLGAILFALTPPLVLEKIINFLTQRQAFSFSYVLLYFALLALAGIFDCIKEILITVFGQKMTRQVRHEMCEKLSRLPVSYFVKTQSGVTVSRFVNDVDTVEELFTSGIISMFVDVCKILSILTVIFVKSRGLGLLLLIAIPVLFAFTRFVQKRMLLAQLDNRRAVGKTNHHIPETIDNIRMIHVFQKEKYMEKKYNQYIEDGFHAMEKSNFYDSIYSPVILMVSAVIISVMMVLSAMGGGMSTFFGMSVGTAVAVISYVGQIFSPLESIGMEIQSIQSAVAGVRRIREFLTEEERPYLEECMLERQVSFDLAKPCIRLDDVDFAYDPEEPIMQGRSFEVATGEMVTLTGRTGAGKSTIFKLILGMYEPDCGSVEIFGVPATQIPDCQKRKLFGYVEQNFLMVPGSVGQQISIFDSEITNDQIEKAARIVGLHEHILQLPDGYNTICSESLFSQGQWQLLSIARAIAADPKILLLDEITANLDSGTEQLVIEALNEASKNRTVLSISHRLYEQSGGRMIKIDCI